MTQLRTYLDHNATSPLRPEARAAMIAALDAGGNASSVHDEGRRARATIETARDAVAAALGCRRDMVTFLSGGTEADNLALKGAPVERIVISAVEHPAVVAAAEATGRDIGVVSVDGDGIVDLEMLTDVLAADDRPALVSLMLANNETGVIQPVQQAARIAAENGALIHCDAVQAVGKVPVRWPMLGVDMLSITGHKFGGPQGAGALIVRDGLELEPMTHGGGQELKRRPGTENISAIAGLGAAITAAVKLDNDFKNLRDRLESELQNIASDVVIFGAGAERLPNTCCFAIPGMAADTSLIAADLDGIAVSSGSACSSGKVAASSVLAAMGVTPHLASCAIRVSLGWNTTVEDINRFTSVWKRMVDRYNQRSAA